MIGGSLELQSNMTITNSQGSNLYFVSNSPGETIVTGDVPLRASLYFQSPFGTGGWKLTGNLITTTTSSGDDIYFVRGDLDLSGQRVTTDRFWGNADNTPDLGFSSNSVNRTLNIAGATITMSREWTYRGGQPLTADQSDMSLIISGFNKGSFGGNLYAKANDVYYNAEVQALVNSSINSTGTASNYASFNKITLSGNNTNISSVRPDSLLFTGYGTYTIAGDFTVNQYIGTPIACGGLTNIISTTPRTITIGYALSHAERVKVRNTHIRNISIVPADTLYNVIDCTFEGTSNGWKNTDMPPQTFYWVGGSGNWSNQMRWADVSNGTPGSGCVPRSVDNVIFDDYSFTANNQTVTINVPAYCDSMSWTGTLTRTPTLALNNSIHINGSLVLQPSMTITNSNSDFFFTFTSSRPNETIRSNGKTVPGLRFNGDGGWALLDALTVDQYSQGSVVAIDFVKGTLNFNAQHVTLHDRLRGNSAGTRDDRYLDIQGATITLATSAWDWNYTGNLQAENSVITLNGSYSGYSPLFTAEANAHYHNLVLDATGGNTAQTVINGVYNKITARRNAIFNSIETDTLLLASDSEWEYEFTSGSTITVNKAFYGSGTPCGQITLRSTLEGTPAKFDIKLAAANYAGIDGHGTMDTLMIDFARIHGIEAVTGPNNAKLYKAWHSSDEPKSGAAWAYGLGSSTTPNQPSADTYNLYWARMDLYVQADGSPFEEERFVSCVFFPYLISSVNLAPIPSSRFKWYK
jgi:hypothetical protein